ncbi:ciliary microtubule inner protein 2B isoform X1 [Anolis carolinensis]|uniref:Ciliary microtubule inner protein 2B n=1 Tax=Anolis carolinensis TaxID=28377 RepID=H9G7D0_ANOCA|nr:PREDICTED: protein FAM166B isoform X1 [Anolis carolinensis]|eukprot:XP_003228316.1 PREDICTED: protein FAM166B isoform X1 [Anolis carolinensis]
MATTFAPKLSSILMTPDPHYIPGYSGYCPRYKFALGQTYGRLTGQLLSDSEGTHPGRLLLQPNCFSNGSKEEEEEDEGSGGGKVAKYQAFGYYMVPGYTGFIPRTQNYFAKSYSQVCKEARSEFARQMAKQAGIKAAWQRVAPERGGGGSPQEGTKPGSQPLFARAKTPLNATGTAAAPYVSRCAFQPQGSPYSLEDSNPQKYFMSGFTGFVPRAQFLIGASYPVITHRALLEFDRMLRKSKPSGFSGSSSHEGQGRGQALPPLAMVFPTDGGLLPHYKGYVPGYKFQFGKTYGQLTHNALGRSTLEKQPLGVQ